MTKIYLDESGHSGDMINSGKNYDFQGQPHFALAGVGLEENHTWDSLIAEMRSRHRIPDGELKSKSLISKPKFSAEIINTLIDTEAPLFVEIVDKRFFICTSITSYQLIPACLGYPESGELRMIRNVLADFLYSYASEHLLNSYIAFCLAPSDATLKASFESIRAMSLQSGIEEEALPIAKTIPEIVETARIEYEEFYETDKEAWSNFLPSPDLNKHNKQIWMLPNLTSFTNIYARLNLFYGGRLSDIRLVHDQQVELDNILSQAKIAVENLNHNAPLPLTPHSDYRFKEHASLEFSPSHNIIGIQLADIIAGATMRYFRDKRAGSAISPELNEAIQNLILKSNGRTGYGLNQVVATRNVIDWEG